jgi:hypothetical protein
VSDKESFSQTTNAIAAAVPCDAGTVRDYCDLGLLEHQRLANGVRLLKPSAAQRVREIRAQRLARRGGRHDRRPTP